MSNPFDPATDLPSDPFADDWSDHDSGAPFADSEPLPLQLEMTGRANGKTHSYEQALQLEPVAPQHVAVTGPANRADVIRSIAAFEAAAKALRESLTAEARAEYDENGTRAVYDVTGVGKVVASVDQAGVRVNDRDAWMKYAAKRWPGEMVMTPTFRNPAFEKAALEALADLPEDLDGDAQSEIWHHRADGRVLDDEMTAVPGLKWVEGGTFRSASLTVDRALKKTVEKMAQSYIAGTAPLEIEGTR